MALPRRDPPATLVGQRMTPEEFLDLPEVKPYLELQEGVVTQKVSPQGSHTALQGDLIERLNGFARRQRIARAFPEFRGSYGGSNLVPDISVYRWERIERRPDGTIAEVNSQPADITIEILSPKQSVRALAARCQHYVRCGVRIALLVNPEEQWVRTFSEDGSVRALQGGDPIDLDAVLPGFQLSVAELFRALVE